MRSHFLFLLIAINPVLPIARSHPHSASSDFAIAIDSQPKELSCPQSQLELRRGIKQSEKLHPVCHRFRTRGVEFDAVQRWLHSIT
jgi:hypothetical protein